MTRPVGVAVLCAVLTGSAIAPLTAQVGPRWSYMAQSGEHSARVRERGSELVFRCLGNALELVLYVDAPVVDPEVKGRAMAFFALIIDDQNVLSFQGRLITDNMTASIGAGGKTANDFAHFIAGAERTVGTSLLTTPPGPGSLHYNYTQYPAAGAADAIKAAYAGCGIPF